MPNKSNYWRLISSIVLGSLVSLPAWAADFAALLPGSVDPGRIANSLNEAPAQKTGGGGGAIVSGFKPTAVTPGAERVQFKLTRLVVAGSTVYGDARLENMFQNYIGHTVSLADLQQMADIITLKYRKDGYILSKAVIPAQQISNGVATIRVIEGYINQVYVTGNPKGSRQLLQEYGDQLKKHRPLNITTLERYALLANDIPGIEVKTILAPAAPPANVIAPSDITPGGVDLTFVAAEHTASGYLSYDNRGTRYLGPQEYTASGTVNSIFRSGDQTGVQALATTDFQELLYFNLYHQTPIGSNGTQFNIGTSYTHTFPGFILRPLGTIGLSKSFTTGLTYPLLRGRTQSLYLNGKFDYLNNRTNLTNFSLILFNDHIRSLRFGADYNLNDRWFGANDLGAQISQGLHAFGASNNDSNTLSRPGAVSDYTKMNFNVSRIQAIPHNFSLLVSGQGQYAFNPLLSAEQFGYGGAQYGIAYDPSEILGDHGIEGKAELRYNQFTDWRALQALQYFAFYDMGKIWNRDPTQSGQVPNASGSSTGFGVRTNFTHYLSGSLEYAIPLTRKVATQGNFQPRIFFSISLAGDTPAGFDATNSNSSTPAVTVPTQNYSGLQMQQVQQAAQRANMPETHTATMRSAARQSDSQFTYASVQEEPMPISQGITPTTIAQTNTKSTSLFHFPHFKKFLFAKNSKTTNTNNTTAQNTNMNYEGLTRANSNIPTQPAMQPIANNSPHESFAHADSNTNQGYYTLQLMGSRKLSDLQQYARKENLGAQLEYLVVPLAGKDWYILTYGQYPSSRSAVMAQTDLTHVDQKPWVRYIKPGTPVA